MAVRGVLEGSVDKMVGSGGSVSIAPVWEIIKGYKNAADAIRGNKYPDGHWQKEIGDFYNALTEILRARRDVVTLFYDPMGATGPNKLTNHIFNTRLVPVVNAKWLFNQGKIEPVLHPLAMFGMYSAVAAVAGIPDLSDEELPTGDEITRWLLERYERLIVRPGIRVEPDEAASFIKQYGVAPHPLH